MHNTFVVGALLLLAGAGAGAEARAGPTPLTPRPDLAPICEVAGTVTTLHSFGSGVDGANPYGGVTEANDGNFYGTTLFGGEFNSGTVYKITPTGVETALYSFGSRFPTDGQNPATSLIQSSDGNLYGTTSSRGYAGNPGVDYAYGTVFKISLAGAFTTVHGFNPNLSEGAGPWAVVQGTDGNLYGTTADTYGTMFVGDGSVFKLTPQGMLTTLHSFTGMGNDGLNPFAGLVSGGNGNFYGTTWWGGEFELGNVFQITPSGTYQTIYSFHGTDGYGPAAALVPAANGSFYGMTGQGGPNDLGTIFQLTPHAVFTVRNGVHSWRFIYELTTLYAFVGPANTVVDPTSLILGTDGNLYGLINYSSTSLSGAIFRLVPGGAYTTLYTFSGPDGAAPTSLIQGSDGNFYGTTQGGGQNNAGTVFAMSLSCVRIRIGRN
jgi:uncharacterized repeat protein (TIGR03803 family)